MKRILRTGGGLVAVLTLLALLAPALAGAKDPQLVPNRLSSIGDSITEAINAEEYSIFDPITPNHWASWANGYWGFWEWFLGRTYVNSHNQRISRNFGSSGRANYLEAVSGADSFDIAPQASQSVDHQGTYVPMLMGHNDVCQDGFADIPTDAQFEANVRAGLDQLAVGLPDGATIYLAGIVDIYKLWELGDELDSLGILSCKTIWATTLFGWFPCATMLSPLNSEADRQYTRSRNIAYNDILESLAAEYQANDPHHHYQYTNVVFETDFVADQVSDFDCFHPSAQGQKDLAEATWLDGPFGAYTR